MVGSLQLNSPSPDDRVHGKDSARLAKNFHQVHAFAVNEIHNELMQMISNQNHGAFSATGSRSTSGKISTPGIGGFGLSGAEVAVLLEEKIG